MPNKHGGATESEIQSQIKQYLTMRGWFCCKIQQSALSYRGIADLYACKAGRSVWIEVKTPKGTQSEAQRDFESNLQKQCMEYIVMRDINDAVIFCSAGGAEMR